MPARRDPNMRNGIWSEDEHDRFLTAIKKFPQGPWSDIAALVGTRSVRQVQTHTQKYYEKIMRRMRGLRKDRKTWARLEHRIDDDILEFCDLMHNRASPLPPALSIDTTAAAITSTSSPSPSIINTTPVRESPILAAFPSISPVKVKRESAGDKDVAMELSYPFLLDVDAVDVFGIAAALGDEQPELLPSLDESLDFLIAAMEE